MQKGPLVVSPAWIWWDVLLLARDFRQLLMTFHSLPETGPLPLHYTKI